MDGMSEIDDGAERGARRDDSAMQEVEPPPAAASPAPSGTVFVSGAQPPVAQPGSVAQGVAAATTLISTALPQDGLSTSIQALKAKQAEIRKQKQEVAKNLRNAERRKKRLRVRARQLTDEDLVQVLMLRKQQRSDRDSVDAASTTSGASTTAEGGCSGSASSGRARSSSDP